MFNRKVLFLLIFIIFGIAAFEVPASKIIGSKQSFTLFEFTAPLGGAFLGPLLGAFSALIVRMAGVIISHQPWDLLTIIRFLPMILAAVYFGTKTRKTAFIFPLCIILFLAHPVGRQAWLYPMLWLIPLVGTLGKQRLFLNGLGATFTSHAVGSVIFLYAFGLSPEIWLSLIPTVLLERGFFTLGIWLCYLIINTVLDKASQIKGVDILRPLVNRDYLVSLRFFKLFA